MNASNQIAPIGFEIDCVNCGTDEISNALKNPSKCIAPWIKMKMDNAILMLMNP